MSIFVISLVVWLVVVFLSVTTGIEKNWLKKLTSLHAPVRLVPSETYYSSYYYQIDQLAAASNYTVKSIGEKAAALHSDPYAADIDPEIPFYWPEAERIGSNRELLDPVKIAFNELSALKNEIPGIAFQDYQIGGALLRLSLPREGKSTSLSQMSFLLSLTDENPRLRNLIAEPAAADLNRLLAADPSLLEFIRLEEVETDASFSLPPQLLPLNRTFEAYMRPGDSKATLPVELRAPPSGFQKGTVVWDGKQLRFSFPFPVEKASLKLDRPLHFKAKGHSQIEISQGQIQGACLSGSVPFKHLRIVKGGAQLDFEEAPNRPLPWTHFVQRKCKLQTIQGAQSVILPKNYRESGVLLGDLGTLSYVAPAAISSQEQRIQIRVAGFYDPGILSVGNKCLIVSPEITQMIHAASETFSPDGTPSNGIFVWNEDKLGELSDAEKIQKRIEERFEKAGIASYWKVATYKEFEFSKDLMLQFQSDRTLFLLIAAILLIVACCNIISLLVLLVNDKKKEIAILQSMGASFGSIARIFGFCGAAMGAASCLIGGTLAVVTLRHLDSLVAFLSALQGRNAFNPIFFGQNLPNQLSFEALLFVLIATPLLSLAAGLVPALKASRIRPSSVLRSE